MADETTTRQRDTRHPLHASLGALTIQEASENSSTDPFDLIAVVSSRSTDALQALAWLLITDPSIADNTTARVTLRGSTTVASLSPVSAGDVVRFYGLIRPEQNHQETPVICNFEHSWKYPQAGPQWTQLSRNGRFEEKTSYHGDEGAAGSVLESHVTQLLDWYSKRSNNVSLPPLPCRRRCLHEIQTPGMLSHVVVQVLSCDHTWETTGNSRTNNQRQGYRVTHATLTDDDSVLVPFIRCQKFETALKSAVQSGQRIMITNVLSVRSTNTGGALPGDAVLLTPTSTTNLVSAPNGATPSLARCSVPPPDLEGTTTQIKVVLSSLKDVFVDELAVSLGDGKFFLSPHGFLAVMVDTQHGAPHYREATLTLDQSVASDCFVVRADASIVETLCGSVEAKDIVCDSRLRGHTMDLLRGLMKEATPLSWTLERSAEGGPYRVTKVSLTRL